MGGGCKKNTPTCGGVGVRGTGGCGLSGTVPVVLALPFRNHVAQSLSARGFHFLETFGEYVQLCAATRGEEALHAAPQGLEFGGHVIEDGIGDGLQKTVSKMKDNIILASI